VHAQKSVMSEKAPRARAKTKKHHQERTYREEAPPEEVEASDKSSDDEEEGATSAAAAAAAAAEEERKPKGVEALVETHNPNRAGVPRQEGVATNRREKEAIEAARKKEQYIQLAMQGKTEEAKRDLERLAAIRREREEAAKRREQEKAEKEQRRAAAAAASGRKADSRKK